VARDYTDLTAIDLSTTALDTVRTRLGPAGEHVVFRMADVLDLRLGRRYALWHDRAVYHFLTEPDERADYLASLDRSLRPDGQVIVATFGPDGPTTCSGLPIVRYTHQQLAAQFPDYELIDTAGEDHITPWGGVQQFTAVLLRRTAGLPAGGLLCSAADDAVQGGDVALVGGSPGLGEAEPESLPGVAHGAALRDVAGIGEH
jgi:SAM-dependent methyltransferase